MKQDKPNRILPREGTVHSKHPLPITQEKILYMDITKWSTAKSDWLYSLQPKKRSSIQLVKTRPGADCGSVHELLIAKCRLKLKKLGKTTRPFGSVQFSHAVLSDSLWPHESQHARPPCPSPPPGVHSDSRPLSQWCHPAISSSVVPFSSCPQSLPASESFPMSQLFAGGGQSTECYIFIDYFYKRKT